MLIKSLILVIFLSGCAIFNTHVKKINNLNCEKEEFKLIQEKLDLAHRQVLSCFSNNKRTADFNNYKNIVDTKEINIKCDPARNVQLASADGPENRKFPQMTVYTHKLVEKNTTAYENSFFRESIHWLGYRKYADIDVSSIADMCCLDHGDKKLNDAAKSSCEMFRFEKKDWTSPAYIRELTRNLELFNHGEESLRTSLAASINASRSNQKSDQVRRILFAPLEEINTAALKANLSRQKIRELSSDLGDITQGIVLASIVNRTTDKILKKQSSRYLQKLVSRFYSNPIDKEKVLFFNTIGDSIEAVIFKKPEDLTKSWDLLKTRAEYVCRDLKKNETDALNELLSGVSYYVFEMKNEIAPGAMFDIATNWSNPCRQ